MPKEEWGVKRLCPTTGKRFYDLNRTPIVSPYTGEVVDIESARGKIASVSSARAAASKRAAPLPSDSDDEDDLLVVDSTEEADIDDDLLEDDEDETVSLDDIADVSDKDDET